MKQVIIVIATLLVIAVVTTSASLLVYAAMTDTDNEQMILDEILPQYEWENYAYDIREITKVPADGKKYYTATFYTGDGKYEFLVVVEGDDVDEEMVYGDDR